MQLLVIIVTVSFTTLACTILCRLSRWLRPTRKKWFAHSVGALIVFSNCESPKGNNCFESLP